jgi:serine phosphatase RsbU (regulator of sigma subunit)
MTSEIRNRARVAHWRGRLTAVGAAACCALGLALTPAATAKSDHAKADHGEKRAAHKDGQGSGAGAATGSASESASSAEESADATESAGAQESPGSQEGSETESSAAAQSSSGSVQGAARKKGGGHKGGGTHHKEGKEGKEGKGGKEGKNGKGKSGEGSGGTEEGSGGTEEGSKSSSGGESPSETPPVTATLTTPVPATALGPSASVATAATPTVGVGRASVDRRATHARRASRPSRRRLDGAGATSAAGGVVPLAAGLRSAARGRTRAPARAHGDRANHASGRGRSSPLVTTITKIVDVVPVVVRLLIAGLLALALALALRSRVAALRARRLERQRGELLEDVGLLQAALLPVAPARLGPVGTSVAYQPATGPGAGGDFYDVFALEDGRLGVIVGDVSGHGRQALPHTALVRFTLRAYLEAGMPPRDAMQTAGAVLERQLGGVFATVVAATYDPRERTLVYSCAGHPPPIVLGAQPRAGSLPALTICASPPIGVGMRTGTRQTVVSIPGRAQVCFFTDGVTEARVGCELFGTERLTDALVDAGPEATAPALLALVSERADARPDDMAACVLSIEGDDRAPTVLVEELELGRMQASSERAERFLLAAGVPRGELAELTGSVSAAAGRAGTVVLELRPTDGPPEVRLRRDQLAYLHARRADVVAAR